MNYWIGFPSRAALNDWQHLHELSIPEVLAKDRLGAMAKRDPEKLAARLSAWISSN